MQARCVLLCLSLLAGVPVGCGSAPAARLDVTQPQLEGMQRAMGLHSEWAHFDDGDGDARRLLLAFPLPGAWGGTQQFVLYVRLSPDAETAEIGEPFDVERVAGFFIQRRGAAAGLAEFAAGRITVSGVAFGGQRWRQGTIELEAGDGTKLRGRFRAERSARRLRDFEEQHAADVAALLAPQAPPTEEQTP